MGHIARGPFETLIRQDRAALQLSQGFDLRSSQLVLRALQPGNVLGQITVGQLRHLGDSQPASRLLHIGYRRADLVHARTLTTGYDTFAPPVRKSEEFLVT